MKVLIVDDDQWYAESLSASLRMKSNSKIKTQIVFQPETAIVAIDEFCPDVILLDFHLGTKNAVVLLNELQSYADTRNTPIIILTGDDAGLSIRDFRHYGVTDIINKTTTTPEEIYRCLKA